MTIDRTGLGDLYATDGSGSTDNTQSSALTPTINQTWSRQIGVPPITPGIGNSQVGLPSVCFDTTQNQNQMSQAGMLQVLAYLNAQIRATYNPQQAYNPYQTNPYQQAYNPYQTNPYQQAYNPYQTNPYQQAYNPYQTNPYQQAYNPYQTNPYQTAYNPYYPQQGYQGSVNVSASGGGGDAFSQVAPWLGLGAGLYSMFQSNNQAQQQLNIQQQAFQSYNNNQTMALQDSYNLQQQQQSLQAQALQQQYQLQRQQQRYSYLSTLAQNGQSQTTGYSGNGYNWNNSSSAYNNGTQGQTAYNWNNSGSSGNPNWNNSGAGYATNWNNTNSTNTGITGSGSAENNSNWNNLPHGSSTINGVTYNIPRAPMQQNPIMYPGGNPNFPVGSIGTTNRSNMIAYNSFSSMRRGR